MNNNDIEYVRSSSLLQDAQQIIESARKYAYNAVNVALVQRNWLLGKRIAEEELQGEDRAKYGEEIIKKLAKELTSIYDKGFTKSNLYLYLSFYKYFPEIFHSASGKSLILLSWTHYRVLLQVNDTDARYWYMKEAAQQTWSVRTLQRNISSQYYFRLLQSQHKDVVEKEILVFYNYLLKCFILIDLKTSKVTHQDVGQMDMYIRMYDKLKRPEGDNPTLGVILCADTDEDIARYSILHGNEQLFASKYKTYLPSEEELRAEIDMQKRLFYLQQQEQNNE